jgi:thiol-disulfide isomerase/thioredoxin
MNKNLSIFILAILVVGIGSLLFAKLSAAKKSNESPKEFSVQSTATATITDQTTITPDTDTKPGQYLTYTPDIIAKTKGTKILFFHAPWCPQCRALEASITSNTIPTNISIIKVDYDSNQTLRQKYGVTIQTSVVKVDDVGQLVKKYVAYEDPSLQAIIENLLP